MTSEKQTIVIFTT